MKSLSLPLILFCFVFASCLLGEETLFYRIHGSTFSAQNVPANDIGITSIAVSWHPEPAGDAVAHHRPFQSKTIWEASAAGHVELAGLTFQLFEAPRGFKTTVDRRNKAPAGGIFSLDLYAGRGANRKIYIYHEFPAGPLPTK